MISCASISITSMDKVRAMIYWIIKNRIKPIIYFDRINLTQVLAQLKDIHPDILSDFLFNMQASPIRSRDLSQIWSNLKHASCIINIVQCPQCKKISFYDVEVFEKVSTYFKISNLMDEWDLFLQDFKARIEKIEQRNCNMTKEDFKKSIIIRDE